MFKALKWFQSDTKELAYQVNAADKVVIENKVQAATVLLTYIDINDRIWVLLVRNHPLTRGASSDISRPFYRLFDTDTRITEFQFPGGSVSGSDVAKVHMQKIILKNKNIFNWVQDDAMQILISGALRELSEETMLPLDQVPQSEDCFFKYITGQDKKDLTRDFLIRLNVFHWHLGKLNNSDVNFLHQALNPGHDICAVVWYPLTAITSYVKNTQEIFSIIPGNGKAYKTTQILAGLQHSYYSGVCTLEEPERYVAFVAENAQWLSQCFSLAKQLYKQPQVIMETEFERIKPIGSGTHDTQLCKHVPTNNCYVLKYVKLGSELDRQMQDNAKILQISVASAEEDNARNELLAAELYRLHGILVPKLELVRTSVGYIIASQYHADYKEDNFRLETTPPENLFDGVGCDLAFANYDAIGNVYKLKFFNQGAVYHRPYNVGFIKENTEVIRIDVGASLRYRAKGALKNEAGFSDTVDINFAFRKDINPGFYNVYANQMTAARWLRAKQRLEKVTNDQRTACVFTFAYGDAQQKQALADRINKRVASTVNAIEQYMQTQIATNSSSMLNRESHL